MRLLSGLILPATLWLTAAGCSNDSGTTGPQTMPVELSVRVVEAFHGVRGGTVQVLNLRSGDVSPNLSAVTDTSGLAVFHSNINVLIPNHTYKFTVIAGVLIQSFPQQDTIRIPSAPNTASGYELATTVYMMLPDSSRAERVPVKPRGAGIDDFLAGPFPMTFNRERL